jgi:hypothetical protein
LIWLRAEEETQPLAVQADSSGAYLLCDEGPPATLMLQASATGALSDTAQVDLTQGAVQLAMLTLETRPVRLPALNVEIERTFRNPRLRGFYRRMERGLGRFITREDLEAVDVVGNFRRIPNVQLAQCAVGTTQRKANCWELNLQRGPISLDPRREGKCPPLIYLNGHLLANWTPVKTGVMVKQDVGVIGENAFTRIQQLPRNLIEGIKVHRNPATAPAQYRMLGDACGIVLVWTRGR